MKAEEQIKKGRGREFALPTISFLLTAVFLVEAFAGLLPAGVEVRFTTLVKLPAADAGKLEDYLEGLGGRKIVGASSACFEIPMEFSGKLAEEIRTRAEQAGVQVRVEAVHPVFSLHQLLELGVSMAAAVAVVTIVALIFGRGAATLAIPLRIGLNCFGLLGLATLLRVPLGEFYLFSLLASILLSLPTDDAKKVGVGVWGLLLTAVVIGIFGAIALLDKAIFLAAMLGLAAAIGYLNNLWISSLLEQRKKAAAVRYHVSI